MWVLAVEDGGIFGWQSKGVPADGVENGLVVESVVGGEGIADVVDAGVSEMEIAGGVGKLAEDVLFGGEGCANEASSPHMKSNRINFNRGSEDYGKRN